MKTNKILSYVDMKFMAISFILHGMIFSFYLFYISNKIIVATNSTKDISIEIARFEPMSKTVEKTEPIKEKIVKPVEKKPVEKIIKKQIITSNSKHTIATKKIEEQSVEPVKNITTKTKEITTNTKESTSTKEKLSKTDYSIIRSKVLANLIYPMMAKRMGHTGIVEVSLTIDTYGNLIDARIINSCGKSPLDKAAMNAVMRLKGQELPKADKISTIILPISFKLEG